MLKAVEIIFGLISALKEIKVEINQKWILPKHAKRFSRHKKIPAQLNRYHSYQFTYSFQPYQKRYDRKQIDGVVVTRSLVVFHMKCEWTYMTVSRILLSVQNRVPGPTFIFVICESLSFRFVFVNYLSRCCEIFVCLCNSFTRCSKRKEIRKLTFTIGVLI